MKNLIVLVTSLLFGLNVFAQDTSTNKKMQYPQTSEKTYCALLKDGKMMLMTDGKTVNADVIFANGAKITIDATLKKKDGSEVVLKNGECVDANGEIIPDEKPVKLNQGKEELKKDKK